MIGIEWTLQLRLVVAIALGFLVGLERESTKIEHETMVFGGVRTNPIISMFGFGCAWMHTIGLSMVLPVGLLGMITLTGVGYFAKTRAVKFGTTSEISALLTFVVGALSLLADIWIPMALAIVNTMLLSEKAMLEKKVADLDRVDFLAMLKFLLVTLIILPVLPDQEYTRFHLNPSSIWKVVILVSTIGFVGYVLSKKFGENMGLWLSGILGGMVSSTAVTIASGRAAQKSPEHASSALQSAMLAGSVLYVRTFILIALMNSTVVTPVWWKFAVLAAAGIVLSIGRNPGRQQEPHPSVRADLQNPFEITPALMFAMLFVTLSIITSVVQSTAGSSGVLTLAGIVGVTDITPFILSLVRNSDNATNIVLQATFIALMSNTIIKGIYFAFLVPQARRATMIRFGIWATLHIPLIVL
jgi:uncharacterized membrane protein (DUF4010 family)